MGSIFYCPNHGRRTEESGMGADNCMYCASYFKPSKKATRFTEKLPPEWRTEPRNKGGIGKAVPDREEARLPTATPIPKGSMKKRGRPA